MLGYWDDPEATAEAIDAARWMHTGDLATMDEEGYVNIVGRIKDMIIRGGENLYPREIEEFLMSHPDVAPSRWSASRSALRRGTDGLDRAAGWRHAGRGSLIDPSAAARSTTTRSRATCSALTSFPMTVTGKGAVQAARVCDRQPWFGRDSYRLASRLVCPGADAAHPLDQDPQPDARGRIVHRRKAHLGAQVDVREPGAAPAPPSSIVARPWMTTYSRRPGRWILVPSKGLRRGDRGGRSRAFADLGSDAP